MPKLVDLQGQTFGRLRVMSHVYGSQWMCRCECGTEKVFLSQNLRSGRTTSCGCFQREFLSKEKSGNKNNLRHGHTRLRWQSPEYRAWAKAKDRCFNERSGEFFRYGGRGITMCEEWRASFSAFLEHIGERPEPHLSLDRIDNDGNYEPGNVRWATKKQQTENRRPRQKKYA